MGLLDSIGGIFGIDGEDSGAGYLRDTLNQLRDLNVPNLEDLKVRLAQMVYQGDLTPEQANFVLQEPTLLSQISENPELLKAQYGALSQIENIANSGGITDIEKADLAKVRSDINASQRGAREAILQNAKERGVYGGGQEILSQLINQQASADRENQAGLNIASDARSRALSAIEAGGNLASSIRGQEYGQKSQAASAQDVINRFNAANRQNVINQNVATENAARERNLDTRQNISNQNTNIGNDQQRYNAGATQQDYQNRLSKITGQIPINNALAEGKRDAVNQQIAFGGQVLSGLGQAGSSLLADSKKKKLLEQGAGAGVIA